MADRALFAATDALNRHARAGGFGRRAIYQYKTLIASEFATEANPVMVMVRCHNCNGTGQYRDWDGHHRGPCYRCTNGVVTLRFVESVVGDYRWHHPVESGGSDVLNAVWDIVRRDYAPREVATLRDGTTRLIVYRQAQGWGPNMPGMERLNADESCAALNIAEDWVATARLERARWGVDTARDALTRYQVHLDRDDDWSCCVCGTADVSETRYGGKSGAWRGGWASFSRRMCPTCAGPRHAPNWPTEPHPGAVTANVEAWLRHPVRCSRAFRPRLEE